MLSIIISILSIIVGVGVIVLYSSSNLLGAYWILSILGAPTTFLHRVLTFWIRTDKPIIHEIIMFSLFFLQYQLLAFGIYKYHDKLNARTYGILIFVIIISAILMYCFQMGKFVR